ncbi:transposase [Haloarcula mannanilytica]
MDQLFRLFLLKEIHGWTHETALLTYLSHHPELCEQLGLETVPDQSTLWRTWHERFTANLRETIEAAARTILIKAQDAGVTVPGEPERQLPFQRDEEES